LLLVDRQRNPAAHDLSRRGRQRRQNWAAILATLLVALATGAPVGFRWHWFSWAAIGLLIAGFLSLSWFYARIRRVDDGRIAETLHETAILAACGPPAAALSYVAAAAGLPLMDSHFEALDLALGFDWKAWYLWVEASPAVEKTLSVLYDTSLPHIAIVLIATGLTGRTDRARELNHLLLWTALPVVLVSGLVPAMSAWIHHGLGLEKAYHLAAVSALRDGSVRELAVGELLGIITFPSFHTVIAVVLVWVCRGIGWLFWPTLAVCAGVLLSIPTEGGHYLVDMLAGAAIAVAVIWLGHRRRAPALAAMPVSALVPIPVHAGDQRGAFSTSNRLP
jgi:hypothetical protein